MSSRPKNTKIDGRTIDLSTNQPVAGTTIEIRKASGESILTTTSDSNGNYSIRKSLSGSYIIYCRAEGYEQLIRPTELKRGKKYTLPLFLRPIEIPPPPLAPEPENTILRIISVSPPNYFLFTFNDTIRITVETTASNNADLRYQYRYILDNTTIRDWGASSHHTFAASVAGRGKHTVTVEVRDPGEARDSRTLTIYIARTMPSPIERVDSQTTDSRI
ncbi:MAG: carboxypeptidase-like regulatory domain-containing protein [Candidatus Omnitrophica bacterium]|nr:carboxypeptidase-like regulatory domain-containing protein [Candidatus Omnitrophota bacterium]